MKVPHLVDSLLGNLPWEPCYYAVKNPSQAHKERSQRGTEDSRLTATIICQTYDWTNLKITQTEAFKSSSWGPRNIMNKALGAVIRVKSLLILHLD